MKVEAIPHLVHHQSDAQHLIDVILHHAQILTTEAIPRHLWSHMFQEDPAHPLICFAMARELPT